MDFWHYPQNEIPVLTHKIKFYKNGRKAYTVVFTSCGQKSLIW